MVAVGVVDCDRGGSTQSSGSKNRESGEGRQSGTLMTWRCKAAREFGLGSAKLRYAESREEASLGTPGAHEPRYTGARRRSHINVPIRNTITSRKVSECAPRDGIASTSLFDPTQMLRRAGTYSSKCSKLRRKSGSFICPQYCSLHL
eukprot:2615616-Rhodomonas_salina.2